MPSGYEFTTLIRDILMVSTQMTELSEESLRKLEAINTPVHIQVFVTPTCPYCPMAVRMAHKFAIEQALAGNDKILGNMIEAIEFPELADQYGVMAVPKVVIKVDGEDKVSFEGAYPEKMFLEKLLEALE